MITAPRREKQDIATDLVIVGSGAAGLAAALAAQEQGIRIVVISKGQPGACGSTFANRNRRWGITYAANDRERQILYQAINAVGVDAVVPELVTTLVEESQQAMDLLRSLKARFLSSTAGPTRVSPCFCSHPLAAVVVDLPALFHAFHDRLEPGRVRFLPRTTAVHLRIRDDRVCGVVAHNERYELRLTAGAVVLATGGRAACQPDNIVDSGLTGDGHRLLAEAGVALRHLHWCQRVWEDVDPKAPRFSFARFFDPAMTFTTAGGEPIALPAPDTAICQSRRTHVPISATLPDREFDELLLRHLRHASDHIRVLGPDGALLHRIRPHVQTTHGGVLIDANGWTGVPGLYAAGELATGMHGPDRVGGTMITACLVFGRRAGRAAARAALADPAKNFS